MAITITANDANRDGTGINFTSYLANYSRKFVRDGYGEFNDDTMSGSQYATKDTSGWGAVLVAGATRWEYDLATHVVTGSLATVAFGTSVALNNSTERFTYTLDVQISGLGISDKNLGGNILADIMDGNTNSLEARLKLDSLVFKGSTGNDTFSGFGRNDVISGNGGNDTLRGGAGNDRINGGAGNNKLFGDAGNDTLTGGNNVDTMNGGSGNDTLSGGAGDDTLNGSSGADTLKGGGGKDKLIGGSDNDKLFGNGGNDRLQGDAGNDRLEGAGGNDRLIGGSGNDTLTGGKGNDTLTGGGGKDTFVFVKNGGNDTVTDFKAGAAKVDVLRVDDSVLRNFDAVLAHADDVKAGVMIDYGKGSILLKGLDVDDLHANDFFFF